jgi:HEAT repeat protein
MYLRSTQLIALGIAGSLITACRSAGPPPPTLDEQVRNFVTPTYSEGVPYDKARALGPQAEPILLQLIDRQDMTAARSNIVVTLGILGSPAAVQRIITVLEAGSGALTPDDVQTRMNAVVALGYASNVAADPTSLNYLQSGTNVAYWIPPRIAWTLPDGGSPASRLRTRAISALGLSGKSDALQMLQQLQTTGGGGRGGPSTSEQALIAEAIETNQYVAKHGLSRYYQTRRF